MTAIERSPMIELLCVDNATWDEVADGRMRAIVISGGPWQIGDWVSLRAHEHDRQMVAPVVGVHRVSGGSIMLSIGQVGYPPVLEIRLPRPIASIKNRRVLGTKAAIRAGKVRRVPFSRKSDAQKTDMQMVRNYARIELARRGVTPFGPDDAILLDIRHMIEADELVVRAMRCGTLPTKRRGTKRDVHGMIETIADALQGVWYDDDRQIDHAVQRRIRGNT